MPWRAVSSVAALLKPTQKQQKWLNTEGKIINVIDLQNNTLEKDHDKKWVHEFMFSFLPSTFQGAEAGLLPCIDALPAGRVLRGMQWVTGVARVSSR